MKIAHSSEFYHQIGDVAEDYFKCLETKLTTELTANSEEKKVLS